MPKGPVISRAVARNLWRAARRKNPKLVWDAWKRANLRARLPERQQLAAEERAVMAQAAAIARQMPGANRRTIAAHVSEALNALVRRRLQARAAA